MSTREARLLLCNPKAGEDQFGTCLMRMESANSQLLLLLSGIHFLYVVIQLSSKKELHAFALQTA